MKIEVTVSKDAHEIPDNIAAGPFVFAFDDITFSFSKGRVRAHGTAHGVGFVIDGEATERDGALHVVGELHVSGTLAGLGQRELALQVRKQLSSLP